MEEALREQIDLAKSHASAECKTSVLAVMPFVD